MTTLPKPDPALHDVGLDDGGQRGIKQVRLLEHFGLEPSTDLLEIGCGLGRLAYELAGYIQGGSYTGFDISAEAIDWLNAEYAPLLPGFRFDLLDVASARYRPDGGHTAATVRFPYEDDSFDLVCAFEVFMHVDRAGVANYLSEVSRVLRQGGSALLTFMAIWDPNEVPTYAGRPFEPIGGGVHSRFPERPGVSMAYQDHLIRTMIRDAGLRITEAIEGRWHKPWDEPTDPGHNCDVYVVAPA